MRARFRPCSCAECQDAHASAANRRLLLAGAITALALLLCHFL